MFPIHTTAGWEIQSTTVLTPTKSNIDTKNDGFKNASPFKYGYFGELSMLVFGGGLNHTELTDAGHLEVDMFNASSIVVFISKQRQWLETFDW